MFSVIDQKSSKLIQKNTSFNNDAVTMSHLEGKVSFCSCHYLDPVCQFGYCKALLVACLFIKFIFNSHCTALNLKAIGANSNHSISC